MARSPPGREALTAPGHLYWLRFPFPAGAPGMFALKVR
jgi:hypothetical protein